MFPLFMLLMIGLANAQRLATPPEECVPTSDISQMSFGGEEAHKIKNCAGLCKRNITCYNIRYGVEGQNALWDCRLDDWSIVTRSRIVCAICEDATEETIDPASCVLDLGVGTGFLLLSSFWVWAWILLLGIVFIASARYYYIYYISQ
jgi:hypothetical protein